MKSVFSMVVLSALGYIGLACFNNVHAWPLLFPLVGGVMVMSINKSAALHKSYGYVLSNGFYGALIACALTMPVIWFLAKNSFRQRITDMGYNANNSSFFTAAAIAIASVGFLFFVTYLIGTAIGAIFPAKHRV